MSFLNIENSLLMARWRQRECAPEAVERLARLHELPEGIARLMCGRGVKPEDAERFLNPKLNRDFPDPLSMAGMAGAAQEIAHAIMRGRGIGVFGDFDVDGATSTAIMVRFLRHCGVAAPIYIPDRTKEGYGPNIGALRALQAQGCELVILVDCGITAHEVIGHGRALGLDIIVLDHHQAEETLPPAAHVVNPNRRDCASGLGMLAACGVTFMTCVAVNGVLRAEGWFARTGRGEAPLKDWLDIVALGTVCDMVPLTGLNRLFVRFGLQRMAETKTVGLKALCEVARVTGAPTPYSCGFALGPRINAGSRVHQADLGARLLCTDNPEEARNIAFTLDDCNEKRKGLQAEMLAQAVRMVEAGRLQEQAVIIVGHEDFHPGLSGLVAGHLREKYDRPAAVIAFAGGEGKGSGRSVPGINMGAAFIDARNDGLLLKGGGHAMAAGFTVLAERLEDFRRYLLAHVTAQGAGRVAVTETLIDGVVGVRGVRVDFVRLIHDHVGPFGQGHEEPLFALTDVRIHNAKRVGADHVSCMISDWEGGPRLKAVAFRAAETPLGQALLKSTPGQMFHLCGRFKLDTWNGEVRVELHIEDAVVAMTEAARLSA